MDDGNRVEMIMLRWMMGTDAWNGDDNVEMDDGNRAEMIMLRWMMGTERR